MTLPGHQAPGPVPGWKTACDLGLEASRGRLFPEPGFHLQGQRTFLGHRWTLTPNAGFTFSSAVTLASAAPPLPPLQLGLCTHFRALRKRGTERRLSVAPDCILRLSLSWGSENTRRLACAFSRISVDDNPSGLRRGRGWPLPA